MKNQTEQIPSLLSTSLESPWIKGPILGASVMAMVTPLLKWTNHAYQNEKMPRGNYFSGAGSYAFSAIPSYAAAFGFKTLLKQENSSDTYELFSSFTAGGLSGLVCTPFESLAQNKQLTNNKSTTATARQMINYHGYSSFLKGAGSVILREGLWSTVYMSAIPMMSSELQKNGMEKRYAQPLAMLAVAGAYGLFSSPLNLLRYRKQEGLTAPKASKKYLDHAKDIFNAEPNASKVTRIGFFFKAGFPRVVTTTLAAGLMVNGTEAYQSAVNCLRP